MTDAMTRHSDADLLAAFVDGQLDHEQLREVTTHLASCEECRLVIGEVGAFQREEATQRKPWRTWLPVAAAVLVAVVAYPFVRGGLRQHNLRNGVHALFVAEGDTERPIEGRFSGQDIHGPARRVTRGGDNEGSLEIQAAAGDLLQITDADNSPAAIRAKALALAALEANPSKALGILRSIPDDKRDAVILNDLAALQCAASTWIEDPTMLDNALLAAEKALVLQPNMPEARFNYALILQKRGDRRAVDAWNNYLEVDPSGPWAQEAHAHLGSLKKPQ